MKTKIIILTAFIVGIFLVGTVSVGIFDWFVHPKIRTIYKPAFHILNDFNMTKNKLWKKPICNKMSNKMSNKMLKKVSNINPCDFTKHSEYLTNNKDYFKTNSQNIIRFKNE